MSKKEQPWPLLIEDNNGKAFAALMSPKAFNKSLEQKILWTNHTGNNRILPMEGDISFESLQWTSGCYRAQISDISILPVGPEDPGTELLEDHSEVNTNQVGDLAFLAKLEDTIAQRKKEMPEGSYTTHLFSKGLEKIKKKTGEELIELLLAEKREDLIYESGDLIYHLMVLWQSQSISLSEVLAELERREG